jgi:hypothetical protein
MQILTGIAPFIVVFAVLAVLAAATSVAVLAPFLMRNRSVRRSAGQPVVTYYRSLAHAH